MTIWQWCSDAYLQHGYKIRFPENTDPVKTYQWRFVKSIADKFNEWEFDEATMKKFIKIAVSQAKLKGVLKKGLAALHQSNMLNICYDILTSEKNANDSILSTLEPIKKWYDSQVGSDPLRTLLQRNGYDTMSNIVTWYQAKRLTDHFIALSKTCIKAVMRLQNDQVEARLLPTPVSLYLLRSEFLSDLGNVSASQAIFGNDWRGS